MGYDWHQNEELSYEGRGEFSPDLVSRSGSGRYYTQYCTVLYTVLYCTVTRRAQTLIERHNSSQPLFLYVAYQAAHGPIVRPPDKYLDMYPAQVPPHRGTF